MSRLDRHVNLVRGKLTTSLLLWTLAWSLLGFAAVVFLAILVGRLTHFYLPKAMVFFWSGLAVSVAGAVAFALWRRPSTQQAAVTIDQELGLKEKFSSALYMRPTSADPFAAAVVKDAEQTADNVSLHNRFPVRWPVAGIGTCAVALAAGLSLLLPQFDLFKHNARVVKAKQQEEVQNQIQQTLKTAMAQVDMAEPITEEDKLTVEAARQELAKSIAKPPGDLRTAQRRASEALKDVEAIKQKISDQAKFAAAQNQLEKWKQGMSQKPIDDKGPIGKATSEMAKGNFEAAMEQLDAAVKDIDKKSAEEQEQAAKQMADMANRLQQMANDPAVQQQIQQQLQNNGASKEMAKQMTKAMEQAANGDKQAQRQLQQMANQMMQQMNNGQGPTAQQKQALQNAIAQAQAQAQNQAQAGNMAQNAQQMAAAMQQIAQASQQQNGQPNGQQQPQQGKQAGGQTPQQQAQAAKQQLQQCKASLKQNLQQMQQQQQASAAAAAGQQGSQADGQGGQPGAQGGQPGDGGQGNQGGQPGGQQADAGQGQGPWNEGDPNQKGEGAGGAGIGNGPRPGKTAAPFAVQQELSPTETDEKGKILASTFVKATALRGESKAELSEVIAAEESDPTDEIEDERVSRQAREAVKDYFSDIREDAGGEAAPAGN